MYKPQFAKNRIDYLDKYDDRSEKIEETQSNTYIL